ncbi:MAG TPA: transglycosylase domain-containing protein, partial [Roseiarcus sp.]|nr:transglycosylase domain-containing protein [Roseiarcus sp.]
MDRFYVSGFVRLCVEAACEGLNIGVVLSLVALALALPAFAETASSDWLKREDLAVTFLDRYGVEVGRRGIKHDDSIPLEQLPDHFIKAVLATEDRRFFSHFGIDIVGTFRALTVDAKASGVVQGGSSITQQLAKNLFLSNERSLERKIKEAWLALWLEHHLTKKEILKLYLDRAYMGGGAFGVEAAAQYYFGKSARDINLAESAMLAGLFKAPTKYSPTVNLPAARARANDVLSNLVEAGFMTEGQVYAARLNPATPIDHTTETSPDWYLDFAYDEVKKLADEGKLGNDRVLTVRTGLDQGMQNRAESVIEDMLRNRAPAYDAHQAATIVAETNGLLRAVVGGRDYGASQFNRAIDAARQPGSSFKIFVYLTALLTGKYHMNTPVDASAVCIGDYCVHNFAGESAGIIPLYSALAQSLNTAAIRLSIKIGEAYWPKNKPYHLARIAALGRSKIVETARAMGITTPLIDTVSLPVGADEVKMIDMVAANAVLANGGKRVVPYAAIEIRNSAGKVIYTHDANGPAPVQVIPADKVAEMNNIMTHVVTEGTGRAAQIPGLAIAGK